MLVSIVVDTCGSHCSCPLWCDLTDLFCVHSWQMYAVCGWSEQEKRGFLSVIKCFGYLDLFLFSVLYRCSSFLFSDYSLKHNSEIYILMKCTNFHWSELLLNWFCLHQFPGPKGVDTRAVSVVWLRTVKTRSFPTNISTQFFLQPVCVCACVCVCFSIILYVNCFGRTMLYTCIVYI